MGQDLATPPKQNLLVILSSSFTVEHRVITGKAENPDPVLIGGLPENKMPGRIRVQVFHGHGEDTKGVAGPHLLEPYQHIVRQYLPVPGIGIFAGP